MHIESAAFSTTKLWKTANNTFNSYKQLKDFTERKLILASVKEAQGLKGAKAMEPLPPFFVFSPPYFLTKLI